ncbi:unnamed protein product, partial [Meganyctiphanes norvegica]
KQTVADGCISWPFDRIQSIIPEDVSLVFVELSLNETIKGRIHIRLNTELPNIRENVVNIFTGQMGPSLVGVVLSYHKSYGLYSNSSLPFNEMKVACDSNGRSTSKTGEIIGYFGSGYLTHLYFHMPAPPKPDNYGNGWIVFAQIEEGMDVMEELAKQGSGATISDCG